MSAISRGRSRSAGRLWRLAIETAATAARDRSGRSIARRDPVERRRYAEDPWAYVADVLGLTLSQPQEQALQAVVDHDRVLIAGANNVGKTLLDSAIGLWYLDARGAQVGDETEERGARVLLVGPDHPTIFQTVYSEMLALARRAESRGHLMPGRWSENSVLWKVREKWSVEPFAPPRKAGEKQAHSAAGRHQREQLAVLCEAQGIPEAVWAGVEGMCSTEGNKVIAETNPTEPAGPFHARSRLPSWRLVHLSALDHDNVRRRRLVIPEAISWKRLEKRIRDQCENLGPWPSVLPDPDYDDFLYALTPGDPDDPETEEPEAVRDDDILGHRDGTPSVWRPRGVFAPQSLGRYPKGGESSLFDPAALDQAMARWRATADPEVPPDRVGLDSSYGGDAICAAPAWGEDAASILIRYQEASSNGDLAEVERLCTEDRTRVGWIHVLPAGRPPKTARWMLDHYPRSHWMIEHAGGGEGVCDHAREVLGHHELTPVNPSDAAPDRLDEEPITGNFRAAVYARAAMLVQRGLVDVPDDPMLREELLAMSLHYDRIQTKDGERRQVAHLTSKKQLLQTLGRSPDRASAFVFALCRPGAEDDGPSYW